MLCPSTIHDPGPHPEATVSGVFSSKHVNDKPDVRITYCADCAWKLEEFGGFFTAD